MEPKTKIILVLILMFIQVILYAHGVYMIYTGRNLCGIWIITIISSSFVVNFYTLKNI